MEKVHDRSCNPWRGTQWGTGFLAQTAAHEGSTLEQSVPKELHSTLEQGNCMMKEWQMQNTECYEWSTLFPTPAVLLGMGKQVEESGVKLSLK